MFQNYFVLNEEKYYTGTVIIVKNMGKEVEASFLCYDERRCHFIYKIKDCRYSMPPAHFYRDLVRVTDKIDEKVHVPEKKTMRDSQINGMFIGWVWYIFLMGLSTILNGAIVYWIIISVIFFSWRSKKIKKEGTYIEW